jgi:GcvH upstream region-like protein
MAMIRFIQKYQWYFYVVITSVIVVSFSFFGTYSSFQGSNAYEQTAFTTVTGQDISRGELEEMAIFISTDRQDKLNAGPYLGANFLNDGVILKDFLETGMGVELISAFSPELKKDLESKMARERSYRPYRNAKAPFIAADTAWQYFAPSIRRDLEHLQMSVNPMDRGALETRINLYLAEKQFPAHMLTQVLRYQERQSGWSEPDPFLSQADLSLFGYHSIDDWFGPKFSKLVAQFIINSASIAKQKGYSVSSEEAYSDLVRNADLSFAELTKMGEMPFNSRKEYMSEQLRRMGLDQNKAVKIWQQVLLFRRLFNDIANIQLVDNNTQTPFFDYAEKTLSGELYRLPESLRFNQFKDLALFETYLNLTANRKSGELALPQSTKSIAQIEKEAPELLQKRYLIELKQASAKELEAKISLKETMAWETDANNFAQLQKEFPELGVKAGDTLEKRLNSLDELDDRTRARVDAFARSKIVASHPEWIEQAINNAESQVKLVNVPLKGGKEPLAGVTDRTSFMATLDKSTGPVKYQAGTNTYIITVLDKSPELEVMNFSEALSALEPLQRKLLEPYYTQVREGKDLFKTEKGFKNFDEVQGDVAALYYETLLNNIKDQAKRSLKDKAPANMIPDIAATYRFYQSADEVKNNPKLISSFKEESDTAKLPTRQSYQDQFLWTKEARKVSRSSKESLINKKDLFKLKAGEWSAILTPANGDISLYHVLAVENSPMKQARFDETFELQSALGNEAKRSELNRVVPLIKEKGAISFQYLDRAEEEMTPPPPMPENDV